MVLPRKRQRHPPLLLRSHPTRTTRYGFRVAEALVKASDVGAPHGRERLFVLADRTGGGVRVGGQSSERDGLTDGRGTGLADANGTGLSGERVSVLCEVSDALARRDAYGLHSALADAADERGDERAGLRAAGASGIRSGRPDDGGELVGYAERAGRRQVAFALPRPRAASETVRAGLPPFPPGRDDYDRWADILAVHPDLAPAVESPVCGMADGVADRMGECLCSRTSELRITGNGVVPAQAEYAFRLLCAELI